MSTDTFSLAATGRRVAWRARRALRRRTRRARWHARRLVGPPSQWHLTVPGGHRLVELRWAVMVRRGRVFEPEEHAVAFADPSRRGAAIETPIGCAACDGRRFRELLHVYDHRRKKPRWNYHVVGCADCGFLFRHPGIRPERLGDLYASGKYAKFLGGKYTKQRIRRYEVTMAPFGPLLERGDGRRLLDFGCGNGLFLELAHGRGFECYGVDLAEDAVAAAPRAQRRLRRAIDRGNRGNMLRAVAFADADAPARWGLEERVRRL